MCGSEWVITPSDPNKEVPPTVRWCFNDGAYCGEGLTMIIEAANGGQSAENNREFLTHCLECRGCRCAAFDPDDWDRLILELKKREHEGE